MANHPIGRENLSPVYTGPGLNFFWPQTSRHKMGVPHATLFAATASENSAEAAAGAMRQSSPSTHATSTQPHTARTGISKRGETRRKKVLKGRAPSREKAQLWRLTATRMERPIRN